MNVQYYTSPNDQTQRFTVQHSIYRVSDHIQKLFIIIHGNQLKNNPKPLLNISLTHIFHIIISPK